MIRCFTASLFALALWSATQVLANPVDNVVAAHYPPLMVADDAEKPGYAIEILREAARRANRDVEITFLPFERAMFAVKNEPATIMPSLFKGKKRDDLFFWIVEINVAELRFATTTRAINTLKEARALRSIVLETGTTQQALLVSNGFENLIELQDPRASARMLQSGRADAWFLTENNMQRVWSAIGDTRPLVFGDIIKSVPIALAASPTFPTQAAEAYRQAIQSMKADGTLVKILQRYGAD